MSNMWLKFDKIPTSPFLGRTRVSLKQKTSDVVNNQGLGILFDDSWVDH
jgi:hypothetical protein